MSYWLVKSESDIYSIDDFKRDKKTAWDGVRNYQARNYLREMNIGDEVLFYHSNSEPIGIVGLAKVSKLAFPDKTQFDKTSDYFDPRATLQEPRWFSPELSFVKKFNPTITLDVLRNEKSLKDMVLLQRGSRLSVQPLTVQQFRTIMMFVSS